MSESEGTDATNDASDIRVRERQTARTARYAVIGAAPAQAQRIWIALHGYGMLASRFLRAFAGTVPNDTCIVAPEALSRFYLEAPRLDGGHLKKVGATWLTRESRDTEIVDAHAWLDQVHDEVVAESTAHRGQAPSVGVLGFSQGVATAMRWIASGHIAPAQFVAWAGGLAQDVNRDAFSAVMQHREMVFVFGDTDPLASEEARASVTTTIAMMPIPIRVEMFVGAHHLDAPLLTTLLAGLPTPMP